jgi:hypothetical protein
MQQKIMLILTLMLTGRAMTLAFIHRGVVASLASPQRHG